MRILGIETSCDETSVAVVEDGRRVRANYIATQVKLHARFGGVVPELASRAHIQRLLPMLDQCLEDCQFGFDAIDAIAVTLGPGLIGALLIGVETAKALAYAKAKPLIPVHHISAHLYSPWLCGEDGRYRLILVGEEPASESDWSEIPCEARQNDPEQVLHYPYVGLVVSGGHTSLFEVSSPVQCRLLGETVDDAAGEAFDKVAKLLELGYPGGPLVEKAAQGGDARRFRLPRPMLGSHNLDFSFSGLKTAAVGLVRQLGLDKLRSDAQLMSDFCASFQEAIVEVLLRKAGAAMNELGTYRLAVVGGVACNGRLRAAVRHYLPHVVAVFPPPILCTDNAAMIAGLAYHLHEQFPGCDLSLNARADLSLT